MNLVELATLVGRMRKAQRDFFRSKSTAVPEESKRLEREVDRAVSDVLAGPSLFGDEGAGR